MVASSDQDDLADHPRLGANGRTNTTVTMIRQVSQRKELFRAWRGAACALVLVAFSAAAQPNTWQQVNDIGIQMRNGPQPRSHGIAVSVNGKSYVGLGFSASSGYFRDLWELDHATGAWRRCASLPGPARIEVSVFVAAGKLYLFGGVEMSGSPYHVMADLWQYDPLQDVWTSKAPLPGNARRGAFAFSVNDQGYIGSGATNLGRGCVRQRSLAVFTRHGPMVVKSTLSGFGAALCANLLHS